MVSVFSILEWKNVLAIFYLIVLLMPFSSNRTIRYYGCYIFYVLYISSIGILLVPIFLLRPKNVVNLTIAGFVFKRFTKVLGIKWNLKNGHILKEDRGAVIVANHQSILDIMGMWNLWEVMGRCTAVAKREIIYVPPFGQVAWLAGLVYIDRSNPKKAMEQLKQTKSLINDEKTKLWLFPEGTRNHSQETLLPFKKGAFRTAVECQAPIIPIVISPYYFIDGKNKTFDNGEMFVHVLDPIPTTGKKIEDVDSLMKSTYDLMSKEYDLLKQKALDLKNKNESILCYQLKNKLNL